MLPSQRGSDCGVIRTGGAVGVAEESERTVTPRFIRIILLCAGLLSLSAAIYIGSDLYAGLTGSGFALVRGEPVTSADGFRYKLIMVGESIGVLSMLGCALLMFKINQQLRQ